MSTHTPVCELLGIDHPIVSAPMAADPRLPAAVLNAGALGTMGLWWANDAGDLVRETAALTNRPFGGNFALTSDQHRRVDQALSAGLRIVSFIFGDPQSYVDLVHDAGGLVMHPVGSAEEARRAVGSGVDVIVAQGCDAGGHVWGGVATLPLVPAVVDAVAPIPGHCGRWDWRRSRNRSRARPRRAGRLAGHPVSLSQRNADPRGIPAPPGSRDRDRCRVVRQPL